MSIDGSCHQKDWLVVNNEPALIVGNYYYHIFDNIIYTLSPP